MRNANESRPAVSHQAQEGCPLPRGVLSPRDWQLALLGGVLGVCAVLSEPAANAQSTAHQTRRPPDTLVRRIASVMENRSVAEQADLSADGEMMAEPLLEEGAIEIPDGVGTEPLAPEITTPEDAVDDGEDAPAESDAATDDSDEEDEEEEPVPETAFDFLPHSLGALTAESTYTGEVFTNTRGGINTNHATRYRGNLDLIIHGDLDQLFGITGATFFIYGGQVHGQSLTNNDVGDWQVLSSIDPYPYVDVTQIQEHWVRQEFLDGRWSFKVGRQDANADFGFADLAGDFLNNSFVTTPTIPMPIWPAQSLGASSFFDVNDNVKLAAGVYQSNKLGRLWGDSLSGQDGYVGVGHLEWKTQIGPNSQLPGTWRVGGWYDTGNWGQITTAPVAKVYRNNYGFFASGDQLLFKEEYGTDDEQGLGVFYEFGWAPGERNFIQEYYGAGVVYRGLLPGRDHDSVGLGIADILFGQATRDRDGLFYENVTEVFYKAQINDYLVIQPDIQFITNPGGNGRDALVAGIRFELVL